MVNSILKSNNMNWLLDFLGVTPNRSTDWLYRMVDLYRGNRRLDSLDDEHAESEADGLALMMEDEGFDIQSDQDVELYRKIAHKQFKNEMKAFKNLLNDFEK